MEGTMLAREGGKYPDEKAVVQGVIEAINKSPNTVIPVYCSGQNIDRIVSLYKAARKARALLVVDRLYRLYAQSGGRGIKEYSPD